MAAVGKGCKCKYCSLFAPLELSVFNIIEDKLVFNTLPGFVYMSVDVFDTIAVVIYEAHLIIQIHHSGHREVVNIVFISSETALVSMGLNSCVNVPVSLGQAPELPYILVPYTNQTTMENTCFTIFHGSESVRVYRRSIRHGYK